MISCCKWYIYDKRSRIRRSVEFKRRLIFLFTTRRKTSSHKIIKTTPGPLLANLSAECQKKLCCKFYKRVIVWVSAIIWFSLIRRDSIIGETHGRPILAETHFCWKKRLFDYRDLLKKTEYSTLTLLRFCWLFWFFVDFFTFFLIKNPTFPGFYPQKYQILSQFCHTCVAKYPLFDQKSIVKIRFILRLLSSWF